MKHLHSFYHLPLRTNDRRAKVGLADSESVCQYYSRRHFTELHLEFKPVPLNHVQQITVMERENPKPFTNKFPLNLSTATATTFSVHVDIAVPLQLNLGAYRDPKLNRGTAAAGYYIC